VQWDVDISRSKIATVCVCWTPQLAGTRHSRSCLPKKRCLFRRFAEVNKQAKRRLIRVSSTSSPMHFDRESAFDFQGETRANSARLFNILARQQPHSLLAFSDQPASYMTITLTRITPVAEYSSIIFVQLGLDHSLVASSAICVPHRGLPLSPSRVPCLSAYVSICRRVDQASMLTTSWLLQAPRNIKKRGYII
jgi:hypothetical protein